MPRLLLALAAGSACRSTADELAAMVEGPALWPVVLTSVASIGDLAPLEGGSAAVLLVDVDPAVGVHEAGITGARVTVTADGETVEAPEERPGLYVTRARDVGRLFVGEGQRVTVRASLGEWRASVTGHGVAPLVVDRQLVRHDAGEDLAIDLPEGYDAEYDQVLVEVYDLAGDVTWSTVPESLAGWLDVLVTDHTPPTLVVPGSAFPADDALYAVAVYGVDRYDPRSTSSVALRSPLSGFSAGSAMLLAVRTRR